MINLKTIVVKALVANIKISDAILIAAVNAVKENGKALESNKTEVSK